MKNRPLYYFEGKPKHSDILDKKKTWKHLISAYNHCSLLRASELEYVQTHAFTYTEAHTFFKKVKVQKSPLKTVLIAISIKKRNCDAIENLLKTLKKNINATFTAETQLCSFAH